MCSSTLGRPPKTNAARPSSPCTAVRTAMIKKLRALFGRRLLGELVGDELNADDQPGSAHLADQRMASGHLPDAVHDQLALGGGVVGQPLVPDDVEGGDGCSARGRRARGGEGMSRDRDIEDL